MALTVQQRKAVSGFCHEMRLLVRDLEARLGADPLVARAARRAGIAVSEAPVFVIESVGPYLARYGRQIYAMRDDAAAEEFFLEQSYDAEILASPASEKRDLVTYVIPLVKRAARGLGPAERAEYRERVVTLLDLYLDYLPS